MLSLTLEFPFGIQRCPAGDSCANKHVFPEMNVGRGDPSINGVVVVVCLRDLRVSSCFLTGKQFVHGPGQVYLAGEEEGKGAKT